MGRNNNNLEPVADPSEKRGRPTKRKGYDNDHDLPEKRAKRSTNASNLRIRKCTRCSSTSWDTIL